MTELVTRWRTRADDVMAFNEDGAKAFRIAADQLEAELSVLQTTRPAASRSTEPSWRERLWTVHSETRMTLAEVLEALNVGRTWFYREATTLTRRTDGSGPKAPLWFRAEDVREWWTAREKVVNPTGATRP
jgi:hypothetical protein